MPSVPNSLRVLAGFDKGQLLKRRQWAPSINVAHAT
jgi:hypothetical protein